jgi:alanine racemase
MPRPIVAHISTQALQHNLRMVRLYAPHARVAAVIKASGYGHGTLRVAQALHDADAFALLNTEAAAQLRHAGLAHPIVMLEGMFAASEIDDYIALHLIPVLHQPEQLQWLLQAELPRPFDVWVKLNTGMNRLGFHPAQLPQVLQQLQSSGNVNRITLMTHFACADEASGVETQLASFNAAAGDLRLQRSLANSAALIDCADARGDWVRPGIMLYGSSPFADRSAAQLGLLPAMTLKSQLISVQNLNVGDAVGYGGRFYCRAANADRHRRLWLCRRLSASRTNRHPGTGRWRPHAAAGAGVDGYAGSGSGRFAASQYRLTRHALG